MSKFNLDVSMDSIAEAVVTLKGAETAKSALNNGLLECHKAKVKWSEIRDSLAGMLEKRGLKMKRKSRREKLKNILIQIVSLREQNLCTK